MNQIRNLVRLARPILLLFSLGVYTARISKENALSHGAQYALLGVGGAVIGYLVGEQLRFLLV